ncbi:hypothetical protein SESBI_49911 [Sesbania bispinosa]|nr:hypothetical protein SESBI_49911 [Sesbania bispinosa]
MKAQGPSSSQWGRKGPSDITPAAVKQWGASMVKIQDLGMCWIFTVWVLNVLSEFVKSSSNYDLDSNIDSILPFSSSSSIEKAHQQGG